MYIHKEGYQTISLSFIILIIGSTLSYTFLYKNYFWLALLLFILLFLLFIFIVSFFRIPNRNLTQINNAIIAPADGKVVVIEEIMPQEYFTDKRIQVSIFMSPLNVHVNRNPVSGNIVYNKYHAGKYLVAWHPKSSTENESHSVVYKSGTIEIMIKQIAGAMARRIVNYLQVGQTVQQTNEMGFIKFGSRVDLILPLSTKITVQLNDTVLGGVTVIGTW